MRKDILKIGEWNKRNEKKSHEQLMDKKKSPFFIRCWEDGEIMDPNTKSRNFPFFILEKIISRNIEEIDSYDKQVSERGEFDKKLKNDMKLRWKSIQKRK